MLEVAKALTLLSDSAFKLYMHLCLEAERQTGQAVIGLTALTRILCNDAKSVEAGLCELHSNKECERRGDRVEICDRFWTYQKQAGGGWPMPKPTSSGKCERLSRSRHVCALYSPWPTKSWP